MEKDACLARKTALNGDITTFRFSRPFDFQAGQYFLLNLGEGLMKPFSFSNSPTEGDHIELTTRMSGSDYKKRLDGLSIGERALVSGPMGQFTYKSSLRKVAFLAGGIGITPFRSICKYATDTAADSDIVLMWGNNTVEEAIFKDVFDVMCKDNPRLRVVHVIARPPSGWTGHSGFITAEIVKAEVPDYPERTFYVCGPPRMVEAMRAVLAQLEVGNDRIVIEEFGGY